MPDQKKFRLTPDPEHAVWKTNQMKEQRTDEEDRSDS